MPQPQAPVLLELAPLPREQLGPFLILGLDKDAGALQIDAHWAERVKAARKQQIGVPLEDINWAREVINDPERRSRAEASTLNLDVAAGTLGRLAQSYGLLDGERPSWQPYDSEKSLAGYNPDLPLPDMEAIHNSVRLPPIPLELPAVARLLLSYLPEALDPWEISAQLAAGDGQPAEAGGPPTEHGEEQQ